MPKLSSYILVLAMFGALTCRASNPFSGQEFSEGTLVAQNDVTVNDALGLLKQISKELGIERRGVGEADGGEGVDINASRPPFADTAKYLRDGSDDNLTVHDKSALGLDGSDDTNH